MKDKDVHFRAVIKRVQGLFLLVLVLLLSGCDKIGDTDTWIVEVHVTKKETVTREDEESGSEQVFLLNCEDASGSPQVFELTDIALEGKFDAEEAFKELRTGKYYKFRVGWRGPGIAGKEGYYPSIYGAVKMEGFDLEYLPNNIDAGRSGAGQAESESVPKEAENAPEESESVPKEAENAPKESESVPKEAENAPAESESVLKEAENAPAESESVPTEAARAPVEAGPVPAETESAGQRSEGIRQEELIESLEESIRAELEESFAEEKESLEEEIQSLRERLEDGDQKTTDATGAFIPVN